MKKLLLTVLLLFTIILTVSEGFASQSIDDKKKEIIALYNSNNLDEAYKLISSMTEDERDYEVWYLLGNISQDFNNDTNAVFFLQKSILLNPDFDKAHYNLANIYLKEKKYNTAIKEYKTAIKINKNFAYYYYNLGCAYLGIKDYKEAKSAFSKAVKLKNDCADFYYNLAYTLKQLNDDNGVKEALDKYNQLKDEEK